MSKKAVWYGILQAGKKTSPVVLDTRLKTKSPKTMYLYNHVQGKFLEYSREIVEPKLKELNPDDELLTELKNAYKAARKIFVADRSLHNRAITAAVRKRRASYTSYTDDMPDFISEDIPDHFHESEYMD